MKEIRDRQKGVERINEKLMVVLQQQSNQFQDERKQHISEIEDLVAKGAETERSSVRD